MMNSPCFREASDACFSGCCKAPFLNLVEFHGESPKFNKGSSTSTAPQYHFALCTISSLYPNTHFTTHESLPSLQESFAKFIEAYPQYSQTDLADQIRAKEYFHLTVSNHVCLDYIGHGIFSFNQLQREHSTSHDVASSSSSLSTKLGNTNTLLPYDFDFCYKSVNLKSQALLGNQGSELEFKMRKRIMDFMNISEVDYTMILTTNQSHAFKLLADSYPFHSKSNLLTVYDYKNDAVEAMIESSKKREARVISAEFSWPNMRILSRKLRKLIVSKRKVKQKGLFVFPLQSRLTGVRYSYQWMSIARENGWHVLLDACALGPKDMETLGLSMFKPDFLICSFFKVFGENPSGFGCLFAKKSIASELMDSTTTTNIGIVSLIPTNPQSHLPQESTIHDIETESKSKSKSKSKSLPPKPTAYKHKPMSMITHHRFKSTKQPSQAPTTTSTSSPFSFSLTFSLSKPTFLLISMASLLSLSFFSLLFLSISSATNHHQSHPQPKTPSPKHKLFNAPEIIQQACKATRFPDSCQASLTQSNHVSPNPSPIKIIQSAIWVSSDNLKSAQSMVKSIFDSSTGNINRTSAAKICIDLLGYSQYRISLADEALPQGKVKDARAWMSAGLCYQYDCWSALKYANDTQMVDKTMSFLDTLIGFSSNALSMMMSYDNFGDAIDKWAPPRTERDGFWEAASGGESGHASLGGFPSKLTADATVCKDGGDGCYKTVQEAVNAAPNNPVVGAKKFVIHIKEGVYGETVRVPLEKKNVVFLGDGMGKTVITGSANVGQLGMTTFESATVGVLGDGFMASELTIQNTAGPDAHQAVAFRSDSDLSLIENCEFLGNQDTLYVHSLRQFYKACRIEGNVDFIFGNSASFFQDCDILVRPRQLKPEKGENNAITAHGRIDPAQTTGLVFHNCLINGTEEYMNLYHSNPKVHKNFLGRPWKVFSRTVFINCNFEALITPQGWLPWDGKFALKTLYYGEFKNSGPGSDTSQRVPWSSQIPSEHVNTYSTHNFIQGDNWIPTTDPSNF